MSDADNKDKEEWDRIKQYCQENKLVNTLIQYNDANPGNLQHNYLMVKGKLLRLPKEHANPSRFRDKKGKLRLPKEHANPSRFRDKKENLTATDEDGAQWQLSVTNLYPVEFTSKEDLVELHKQSKNQSSPIKKFNQAEFVFEENIALVLVGKEKKEDEKQILGAHYYRHYRLQAISPELMETILTEDDLRLQRLRLKPKDPKYKDPIYIQKYVQRTLDLIDISKNDSEKQNAYSKELSDIANNLNFNPEDNLSIMQTILQRLSKKNKEFSEIEDKFFSALFPHLLNQEGLVKFDEEKSKTFIETALTFARSTGPIKELLDLRKDELSGKNTAEIKPRTTFNIPNAVPLHMPETPQDDGPSLFDELEEIGVHVSSEVVISEKQTTVPIAPPATEINQDLIGQDKEKIMKMIADCQLDAIRSSSKKNFLTATREYLAAGYHSLFLTNLQEADNFFQTAEATFKKCSEYSKAAHAPLHELLIKSQILCNNLIEARRLGDQRDNPEDNAMTAIEIYLDAQKYIPGQFRLISEIYLEALKVADTHGLDEQSKQIKSKLSKKIEKCDPSDQAVLKLKLSQLTSKSTPRAINWLKGAPKVPSNETSKLEQGENPRKNPTSPRNKKY